MNQENNVKIISNNQLQSKRSETIISAIAFFLFAINFIIILSAILYGYRSPDEASSGWPFLFSIFICTGPLFGSFILSIFSIIMYLKDKNIKTIVRKILYILNWITVVILVILIIIIFVTYLYYK